MAEAASSPTGAEPLLTHTPTAPPPQEGGDVASPRSSRRGTVDERCSKLEPLAVDPAVAAATTAFEAPPPQEGASCMVAMSEAQFECRASRGEPRSDFLRSFDGIEALGASVGGLGASGAALGPALSPRDSDVATFVAAAGAGGGVRLHHLDWLRSIMVALSVYLHCWQVLCPEGRSDAFRLDIGMLRAGNADLQRLRDAGYAQHDSQMRWVQLGRQSCIPLLFFINGSSLALSRSAVWPSFRKISLITAVGMLCNFLIYVSGPMDGTCYLVTSDQVQHSRRCKGLIINFVVVADSEWLFSVLFQFWFTAFLLVFLFEDSALYNAMRSISDDAKAQGSASWRLKAWLADSRRQELVAGVVPRWAGLGLLWLGFAVCVSASQRASLMGVVVWMLLFEVLFNTSLAYSIATPATQPRKVRLWQYVAAALAVVQMCTPRFYLDSFDGNVVLYFHIFKQFSALGYAMALTKDKSAPVVSRGWPIVIPFIIFCAPSTNFFVAGVPTYPWLPKLLDRYTYTAGSFMCLFIVDRAGRVFGAHSITSPLPRGVNTGTLLSFVFHPVFIVLWVSLVPNGRHVHPLLLTLIMVLVFVFLVRQLLERAVDGRAAANCREPSHAFLPDSFAEQGSAVLAQSA